VKRNFLMIGTIVCICIMGMLSQAIAGGIPTKMGYQGYLTDDTGAPMTATVSMDFALYPDGSTAIQLWSETHAAVEVVDGLFEVELGSVNPIPDSAIHVCTYPACFGNVYLGITVESDDEIDPRTQMVSVPHAYISTGVAGHIWTDEQFLGIAEDGDPTPTPWLVEAKVVENVGRVLVMNTARTDSSGLFYDRIVMTSGANSGWVLTCDGGGNGTWTNPAKLAVNGEYESAIEDLNRENQELRRLIEQMQQEIEAIKAR
jgi:hypothetical protein